MDWNTGSSWSTGSVPGSGNSQYIIGNGIATIGAAAPACGTTFVGQGAGNGTVYMTGGSITMPTLYVGCDTGRFGYWWHKGGALTVSTLAIGTNPDASGASGQVALDGGTIACSGTINLGENGLGQFTTTAGSISGGSLIIASGTGSGGSLYNNAGGSSTISGAITVGSTGAAGRLLVGAGSFSWGGLVTVNSGANFTVQAIGAITGLPSLALVIPNATPTVSWTGSSGTALTVASGGTMQFNLGNSGGTTINLNSGKINLSSGSTIVVDGSNFTINDGSAHTYNLVTHGGYAGATSCPVQLNNFVMRTATVAFNSGAITVTVGARSPIAYQDLLQDTWVGTDDENRALPTNGQVGSPGNSRFVGVFYTIADTDTSYSSDWDVTKILANSNHPWGMKHAVQWWGQPQVGYFRNEDPWVIRHDLSMLAEAGVDVLFFDATNGWTYDSTVKAIFQVAEQMKSEGIKVPQFAFATIGHNTGTGNELDNIYTNFYAANIDPDLWFYWQGKPFMLGDQSSGSSLSSTVNNFFTWRSTIAFETQNTQNRWSWMVYYPQFYGYVTSGVPEEVSVDVASYATIDSGRSYNGSSEPTLNSQQVPANEGLGVYAGICWQRAISILDAVPNTDPTFVFVTGWNEWTAGRDVYPADTDSTNTFEGLAFTNNQSWSVDEYNQEFSRDMMPMSGGHKDNYYMQLAENIRTYKGTRSLPVATGSHTITGLSQWANILPVYYHEPGGTRLRDWDTAGFGHTTDTTGRNDIVQSQVACDATNIYFYVQTAANITPYTGANWMQLLINTDQNQATGWEGYDYVVNSTVNSATSTNLKNLTTNAVTSVNYILSGNQMMITIPRTALGLSATAPLSFDFHWVDNCPVGGSADINAFWYTGDSAPDGRYNYRFSWYPLPAGLYTMVPGCASGLTMDAQGAGTANGTLVDEYTPNGGGNQKWLLSYGENGYYEIQPSYDLSLALDDYAAGTGNGNQIDVWAENGTGSQRWFLTANSNGSYSLHPQCALSSSLDVPAANTTSGTTLDLYGTNNTPAQQWTFTSVAPLANGTYTLSPENAAALKLEVVNNGTGAGTGVCIDTANGASDQKWVFTYEGNGLYQIQPSSATALALDIVGAGYWNGTAVDVYTINGTTAQRWTVAQNGDGSYTLTPVCGAPDGCLTAVGTTATSPVNMSTATSVGGQYWNITASP